MNELASFPGFPAFGGYAEKVGKPGDEAMNESPTVYTDNCKKQHKAAGNMHVTELFFPNINKGEALQFYCTSNE